MSAYFSKTKQNIILKYPKENHIFTMQRENGQTVDIPYIVRRSKRAKYVNLSLGWGNSLELVIPVKASLSEGVKFLKLNKEWIEKNFYGKPPNPSFIEYLTKHPTLYLNQQKVNLHLNYINNECLILASHIFKKDIHLEGSNLELNYQLKHHLKRIAKIYITQAITDRCTTSNLKLPRLISIRDQSTRWGSCSYSKQLSLNWRMILIDHHLQNYVILHELAHLYYMDHSQKYWQFLAGLDPRCFEHDKELKALTPKIFALGRI